jgi:hypothetical protein
MSDRDYAVVAYVVKNNDGTIGIRIDDARRVGPSTVEQTRLFTILRCSEEDFRACRFTDEQFADLGNAILARLGALQEPAGKAPP